MKTKLFNILLCGLCLFCQSCQDEDEESAILGSIPAPRIGLLLDGGRISGINLYCLENNAAGTGTWDKYYPKTKTVPDYNSFEMCLMLNDNASVYLSDDRDEMNAIGKIEVEYEKERSSFILEDYINYYGDSVEVIWPDVYTAYTKGEISITCDKTLFGEQPGTNLTSHFTVLTVSYVLPVGIENPKLLYYSEKDIPTNMAERFVDGVWLEGCYYFKFSEQPSEKYEELTLSISIPMVLEHIRKYAVEKYKGGNPDKIFTDSVFNAECLIKFNWE